jgi:hypothetical protein
MPNYDEIIKQSEDNINSLSEKLKGLDKLYQEIKSIKESSELIPEIFSNKFLELVKLSEGYTNTLGLSTINYLDGNNTLFTTKLSELSIKIKEFENEINRLVNTDFTNLFKDLQKEFIEKARADLAIELKLIEEKSKDLQTKIEYLKIQVDRLDKIDLEKHFDKLQKTLAEIFGAINSINLTLTNTVQTLTSIVQTLGTIQTSLETNHKESKQLITSFNDSLEKLLTDQNKQASKDVELLELKIKTLSDQNALLFKDLIKNRIIQIAGTTIMIILLIYVAAKK